MEYARHRTTLTTSVNSIITLCSIGIVSYYLEIMSHELIGHGVPMFLYGHREFLLTSTSIDDLDKVTHYFGGKTMAGTVVSIGGACMNIVLALLLGPAFLKKIRQHCSGELAFFLWACAASSMFMGSCYPGYSAIFNVGDFAFSWAVHDPAHLLALRAGELLFSIVACSLTVKVAASTLTGFPGNRYTLGFVPYLVASLVFIVAGLRMHNDFLWITSTIPATLIGMAAWPLAAILARNRSSDVQIEPVRFSWTWAGLAIVCTVVITLTAPGVHIQL